MLPTRRLPRSLSLALVCACITAPLQGAEMPADVTDAFWNAVAERDVDAARALTNGSGDVEPQLDLLFELDVAGGRAGRTVIEDDRAEVETALDIQAPSAATLPARTHLALEREGWRVDLAATLRSLTSDRGLAAMLDSLQEFQGELEGGIDRTLDWLERALPLLAMELDGIRDDVETKWPEIRDRLEALARELERSLPPDEAERNTEDPTLIAI